MKSRNLLTLGLSVVIAFSILSTVYGAAVKINDRFVETEVTYEEKTLVPVEASYAGLETSVDFNE